MNNDEPHPDEQWFDAIKIENVYAKKHLGVLYVHCPFCESLNRLPDNRRGHLLCGDCKVTFNIL